MEEEKNKGSLTESTSFLGRGWSFPPEFLIPPEVTKPVQPGRVAMTADEDDIQKSLEILLGTRPGERVMQPDFGCNLDSLSFEPLTSTLESYVIDLIKTSILYYESRIEVEEITLNAEKAQEGKIMITINYVISASNTRSNIVYPFYLIEGTNI